MTNEMITIATALFEAIIILFSLRLGKEWLLMSIILNMVLITTFGAKLITIFGFTTNAGNVFFASVFLATHMLSEHYGKEGYKTVWIGFASIVFFLLMAQFTVRTIGAAQSESANQAIGILFQGAPRIALASMVGYITVQSYNVSMYLFLYRMTGAKHLWLRSLFCTLTGQCIDSVLFFTIAFAGIIPTGALLQTMLIGYTVKVLIGILGMPFLYLSTLIAKHPVSPLPAQAA